MWPYHFWGKTILQVIMNALCFWKAKKGTKTLLGRASLCGHPWSIWLLKTFVLCKHGKRQKSRRHFWQPFITYFMFFFNPPHQNLDLFHPQRLKGFLILQERRERGNSPITQSLWTYHPSPVTNFFIFEFWSCHLSNNFLTRFSNTSFCTYI